MTQAILKQIDFDRFLDWKPDTGNYELHNGVVVEMPNPVDGEYQIRLFRGSDRIESSVFPELNLPAQQIFDGG
jgi:Uma2 family endonuclease